MFSKAVNISRQDKIVDTTIISASPNGVNLSFLMQLYQKGIGVTIVCPGPIETSNGTGAASSENKASSEVSFLQ